MDTEDDEMEYISLLADNLNELLHTLDIQLSMPIESPTDLTPSLLIVILECLLGARIPVEAYTYPHRRTTSMTEGIARFRSSRNQSNMETINRIQSMKLFLGVLEHDVLGMDAGLSDVDPRRLARGEWEEVVYVAEVLCWIAVWLREEEEDETTPVFGDGELDKGFVDEEETIGLGIYEQCSPSLLSNDLASDLELNASFTLRVPSVCGSECGREQEDDPWFP